MNIGEIAGTELARVLLFGRPMWSLRASLAAGVLYSGSLLVSAPAAHACAPALALDLTVAAHAGGTIVLLARCREPERCPELSTLRLERASVAGALSGTVEVKPLPDSGTDQLVFFRSAQPFEGDHALVVSFDHYDKREISLPPPATAEPFEGLTSQTSERYSPVGEHYSCGQPPRGCVVPSDWVEWDERLVMRPILRVGMPSSNGWLFRTVSGTDAGGPWQAGALTAVDLSPDVESCVALEAWNLLTDVRETRSVCVTGPKRSGDESDLTTPTPSLARCSAPPVRGDGEEASELFERYCNDRAIFCGDQSPSACALDPRCGDLRGAMAQPPEPGCALGHRGGHAWVLASLLLALSGRRARRR